MAEYNTQNAYLYGLIESREVLRCGASGCHGAAGAEKPSKRSASYRYFAQTKDLKRVQVCTLSFVFVSCKPRIKFNTVEPRTHRDLGK